MSPYLGATGRRKRILELPISGKLGRALREGTQTCPEEECGVVTWKKFLHGRRDPAAGRISSAYDRTGLAERRRHARRTG